MDRIFTCILLQLERIENKLDLLTEIQDEQGKILDEQRKMLDEQKKMLDKQGAMQDEQEKMIDEERKELDEGRERLDECGKVPGEQGKISDEQGKIPDEQRKTNEHEQIPNILSQKRETNFESNKTIENDVALEPKCSVTSPPKTLLQEVRSESPLYQNVSFQATEIAGKFNASTQDIRTKELKNKLTTLLKELTPQNQEDTASQIEKLPIHSVDRLCWFANFIISQAITHPDNSESFAQLSKTLHSRNRLEISNKGIYEKNQTDFQRVLLNTCQMLFEQELSVEEDLRMLNNSLSDYYESKKRLQHSFEMCILGTLCRFIGELFKLNMILPSAIHNCIVKLLKNANEEQLESLCELMTTISGHYRRTTLNENRGLQPILYKLANLRRGNRPGISLRVWSMIGGVLELYQDVKLSPKISRPRNQRNEDEIDGRWTEWW